MANNYFHQIYIDASVAGRELTATTWAITNLDAVRDIQAVQVTTQSDVVVSEVNIPGNGAVAWTQCSASAVYGGSDPNRYCYPQLLKYNTGGYASDFSTDSKAKSIACHELGHTMGLRHAKTAADDANWTTSCMRDFAPGQRPNVLYDYTPHDEAHLNSNY